MNYNITRIDSNVTRVSESRKPSLKVAPRTRTIALTPCVSYKNREDADAKVNGTVVTRSRTRSPRRITTPPAITTKHTVHAWDLAAIADYRNDA